MWSKLQICSCEKLSFFLPFPLESAGSAKKNNIRMKFRKVKRVSPDSNKQKNKQWRKRRKHMSSRRMKRS